MRVPHLHNLRDVGGLPVPGGAIRSGRLFRSAAPLRARPEIARDIAALGVAHILDLRDAREQAMSPQIWQTADLTVHHIPVFGNGLADIRFSDLAELYAIMIESHTPAIVRAIESIAEASDAPVLVHCTAGKDRTGVVIGILLSVLGATRADILDDYERSQALLGEEYLEDLFSGVDLQALPGGAAHRATSSPRALLDDALTQVDDRYGSAEGLLRHHGFRPEHLRILRQRLIMTADSSAEPLRSPAPPLPSTVTATPRGPHPIDEAPAPRIVRSGR